MANHLLTEPPSKLRSLAAPFTLVYLWVIGLAGESVSRVGRLYRRAWGGPELGILVAAPLSMVLLVVTMVLHSTAWYVTLAGILGWAMVWAAAVLQVVSSYRSYDAETARADRAHAAAAKIMTKLAAWSLPPTGVGDSVPCCMVTLPDGGRQYWVYDRDSGWEPVDSHTDAAAPA